MEWLGPRTCDQIEQIGVAVGDHRHVGLRARFERFDEQQIGALVRAHLPGGGIADRNILDRFVVAELDHRLNIGLALDEDHLVGIVHTFDKSRIIRERRARAEQGDTGERGHNRADHFTFSVWRAGAALKREPSPVVRDAALLVSPA